MVFDKQDKKFLLILFSLALLIRSAVFVCYLSKDKNYWQVDSNTYHLVATEITKGNGISLPNGRPNFYRLPGYPLFLSWWYKFFGVDTKNVLWLQIVIASIIPLLAFFLACLLFPGLRLLAKLTGLYCCFHLGLVLYAGFFMTETLFIFFFFLFLLFFLNKQHFFMCSKGKEKNASDESISPLYMIPFFPEDVCQGEGYIRVYEYVYQDYIAKSKGVLADRHYAQKKVFQYAFTAGFFLGLASLVRPVGHYILVIVLLMTLLFYSSCRGRLQQGMMLLLGWLMPVGFWLGRNYVLLGYVFFHTLPGGHFLYLSAARVAMHVHDVSYQEARKILSTKVTTIIHEKEGLIGRRLNEIERCHVHEKLALYYFFQRPWQTLQYWLTDIFRASFSLYSAELLYLYNQRKQFDYFKKGRGVWSMVKRYLVPETDSILLRFIVWAEILTFFIIFIGFASFVIKAVSLGVMQGHMNEQLCVLFKLLPFMGLFIVIALAGGYARMRLPIEPLLALLSLRFWLNVAGRRSIQIE